MSTFKTSIIFEIAFAKALSIVVITFLSLSLFTGCADSTLKRYSSDFQEACSGISKLEGDFYSHLNSSHKTMCEAELKIEKSKKLPGAIFKDGGLLQLYSDEHIQVRVKSAQAVEHFGEQLKLISDAKSEGELKKNATGLGSKLISLGGSSPLLQAATKSWPVSAVGELFSPLKTISDFGVNTAFDAYREKQINDLLNKGQTNLKIVCEQLSIDSNNSSKNAIERTEYLEICYLKLKNDKTLNSEEQKSFENDNLRISALKDQIKSNNLPSKYALITKKFEYLSDHIKTKKDGSMVNKFKRKLRIAN